jgi:diguanylate cyclase (GGDEF)-like protein
VGVLSLYSTFDKFSDDHRRIVEAVSRHIANTFRRAAEFDTTAKNDSITGLPTLEQLHQFLEGIEPASLRTCPVTLLFIEIVNLNEISSQHGRPAGEDALRAVSRCIQECLRVTDLVFKSASDEFVAAVNGGLQESVALSTRIRDSIRQRVSGARSNPSLRVQVEVHPAEIPSETTSFREFISAQRTSLSARDTDEMRRIH